MLDERKIENENFIKKIEEKFETQQQQFSNNKYDNNDHRYSGDPRYR